MNRAVYLYRAHVLVDNALVLSKLELGDNIYGQLDIIGLYSTTVTYLASKAREFSEKRKIRAIAPFKVIQGHRGRYQSKARMQLPISD